MSGTYGHELRNLQTSKAILEQRWGLLVDGDPQAGPLELRVTGYSCRSQVHRLRQQRMRHPVQALLQVR